MEDKEENKDLEGQESAETPESTGDSPQPDTKSESTREREPLEEEYDERITVGSVAKKWGLYVGLISIVYGLIQQFAGLATNNAVNYLGSIILIAGVVLAHNEFKKEGNGFMSYKQGFSIGALITLWSSLISIVFTYVYIKFVDDSMLGMIKDKQIEEMEERGMSESEIDQAMEFTGSFMTAEVIMIFGLIGSIVIGIILSLIISAITKKDDPSLEI